VLEDEARSIFLKALELDSAQWDGFAGKACASDAQLRARVDELLRAHREMGHIGEEPAKSTPPFVRAPVLEGPGAMIGPYRLLEQIGEGGFGVVYMAEQLLPVRRKVALKVIKPGMDTRQVVARFEAERQALALMDHPNIARVLDGGTTATGRPYFVMELVRGVTITEFCDENRLPLEQRIDLFITVCRAVQHAHQKGIIHRDLKPSNVMVTVHDDKHVVKVIDFGIAKAVGHQLTEKTLFTNFAQMIGTPPYMSPEQAQLSGLDVDTRSDIYSLGVLLYELLTGTTPFDQARLRTAAFDEIRRIIREETPPRPSTRLNSTDASTATASARRGSDPRRLSRLIRGELDWIVMKCLEKDRNRRYETANGLAADLDRYLNHEPVQAFPPSAAYRLRMFTRRHRASVWTAGLLLAVAAVGSGLTVWQAFRAAQAREAAVRASLALSAARQEAAEERVNAMARDLETLNRANRLIESGRSHIDSADWTRAEADLTLAASLRPDHSSVWLTRGDAYARLGLLDLAAADFQRASRLHEPGSARSLYLHALLRLSVGDEAGYREVCKGLVDRFDNPADPKSWEKEEVARGCLLVEGSAMPPDRLVLLTQHAFDAGRTAVRLASLGTALYRAAEYETGLERLQESKAADPRWDTVWSDSVSAMIHHRMGRPEPARAALRSASEALSRRLKLRSDNPGATPSTQWWDEAQGQLYFREATRLIAGAEPRASYVSWSNRGDALLALGRDREAIESYGRAVELDPKAPEPISRRFNARMRAGDWPDAIKDLERLRSLNPEDPTANNELAWRLCTCPDRASRDYRRAVELARKTVSLIPLSGDAWNTLAVALFRAEDWDGAVEAAIRSMSRSNADDPRDWLVVAMGQWHLGQQNRARKLLPQALRRYPTRSERLEYLEEFRNEAAALIDPSGRPLIDPVPGHRQEDPSGYTLILEIDPGASWAYRQRSVACALLKQWDQSAADAARAAEADPGNTHCWYAQAAARLGAGDVEGYRRVRSEILRRFRETKVPWQASHLCYISAVEPATPEEAEEFLKLAEFGVSATPGNPRIRGAMNYRAGRFEAAINDLNLSAPVFPRRAWDWLFLAMAHQQLGHTEEARKNLKQAVEWIGQAERTGATEANSPWVSWCEPVEVEHLLREARSLIR
jgi:serine/threonine protein kinase/tetratricopeptide (TPR) repeat protein